MIDGVGAPKVGWPEGENQYFTSFSEDEHPIPSCNALNLFKWVEKNGKGKNK